MKQGMGIKIAVDFGMTVLLILLMTYERVGQAVHEWLGVGIFLLFVLHHVLNRAWWRNMLKGRYTILRIFQTVLAAGVLLAMVGSMVSGVILSRSVFAFLSIRGGRSLARGMHMVCAYGGFVLMSLHLGFHWAMMMGIGKKCLKKDMAAYRWVIRAVAAVIAVYGVYAFIKRDIGSYMLLISHFAFFDYEEPLILFVLDYISVMGLFVFVGHYMTAGLRALQKMQKGRSEKNRRR